jgi:LysM repeat protein
MKRTYYIYTFILWLLTIAVVSAQSSVYFFYDPACMQKFDYEQVKKFNDVAYTDYYISITNQTKAIFRVQKDPLNLNKKLVDEIPVKPYMCEDRGNISGALMDAINSNRRMAYMVVEAGNQYLLYEIRSASTLTETQSGIVYDDPTYGFKYDYSVSKSGEILNKQTNKERNVFFEQKGTISCLSNYQFKVVSRHIETPIKHLSLISTVGVNRIYTTHGALTLKSINDVPFPAFMAKRCNAPVPVEVVVDVPNVEPTGPVIKDTVGMSDLEKRLWLSKKMEGFTARTIDPIVKPIGGGDPRSPANSGNIENSGNPRNVASATVANELLPGGIYLVKEKENLYTISEKFGISIQRLLAINQLEGYSLGLNQALKVVDDGTIPSANRNPLVKVDPVTNMKTTIHVVEQGETLYEISKLYGLELKDVYNLNKQLTDSQIDINQQLVVGYQQL